MPRANRSEPMPVKHWSSAGILLTYWCNARCASCYLCCGPHRREEMEIDLALTVWRSLVEACPRLPLPTRRRQAGAGPSGQAHRCRVHLTGGEPFGDPARLLTLLGRARREGLAAPNVETNAFWATDAATVRERLAALDEAGVETLAISADPYHQQFVPLRNAALLARIAEEILGPRRVQVRWKPWLTDGCDTDRLAENDRRRLFAEYAAAGHGRDRMSGRAAAELAPLLPQHPPEHFADSPCREPLLRSRNVHVDPGARAFPGTCAGIVLGTLAEKSVADVWRRLDLDHRDRPVLGALCRGGPVELLALAGASGFRPRAGYASKCHLCWHLRGHLAAAGLFPDEIGPQELYLPPQAQTEIREPSAADAS